MDYRQKTIRELRGLARAGDAEAQQAIAKLGQYIKPALERIVQGAMAEAISKLQRLIDQDGFFGLVVAAERGDTDALERLAEKWFTQRGLFWPERWQDLEPAYLARRETYAEQELGTLTWPAFAAPNLYQAIRALPDDTKAGDVYKVLRRKTRLLIEQDLLGVSADRVARELSMPDDDTPEAQALEAELWQRYGDVADLPWRHVEALADMARLPERWQAALLADEFGGDAAVAEHYGVKTATVRKWRERGLKMLGVGA